MTDQEVKQKEEALVQMTGKFCALKLDNEYLQLCQKLVRKLGKEDLVPFRRGRLEIWAAAIVHVIGTVNFLFDKSHEPHIPANEIFDYFGVKPKTASNKSGAIQRNFEIWHFDSDFSTAYAKANNPFEKLVMVDGLIVSLDNLPPEIQQLVKEKRAQGEDIELSTN